jgi:aldehyde dehydrogenase (NAD+)
VSSTSEDVDAAVDAAKEAYKSWRLVPAPKRAEILYRTAELLVQRKEEFSKDMTREMGKVLAETRGDVQEAIDAAYYNAGEGRRMFGPTVPSEMPNKFAMAVRQPIGVCGTITPWNFPMAIPSWKLLPAVVCGNTCVIKPAQDTPLSTFNLVRALVDAGLPKGVINVVTGFGPDVGMPLTEHAEVRAISLTGSSAVGRIVGTIAAKSFKHCSLELGGKNPMIVLDDANLELAIEGGLWGGFGTTGQRCTATSRIIVQKGVYREFIERYVERAKKLKIGNGLDETVQMGPAINEKQLQTDLSYVEIGKDEGAKLVCGGNRLDQGEYKYGWFMEPTVFTDVDPKMRIAQEEVFGPVVAIIPCDDLEDAIEIANGIEYGLSSALYTKDVNKAFSAIRDLYAGITYINAPTIGA